MGRLKGKVAIITGAAGGQGAAEARLFAKEGANVVATDLNDELLAETVKEINELSFDGKVIGVKHDVGSKDDWDHVVSETVKNFGQINILVNNAGITMSQFGETDIEDFSLSEWDKTFNVNTYGNFLGIRAVTPELKKVGSGSIINISSIAGMVGGQGGVAYHSSKGAVRALSKAAAIELAPQKIRVNSIYPGAILTPMVEAAVTEDVLDAYKGTIPLGFLGEPEDVGHAVLFLA